MKAMAASPRTMKMRVVVRMDVVRGGVDFRLREEEAIVLVVRYSYNRRVQQFDRNRDEIETEGQVVGVFVYLASDFGSIESSRH